MVSVSKEKIEELSAVFLDKNSVKHFEIIHGEGNLILSAPHSVEQTREGKIKYAERQTGVLCKLAHEYTNIPVIYKLRNNQDDANYDKNCEYKSSLIDYIKQNGIRYLMDLHQLAPSREVMIDIGTGRGRNIFSRDDIVAGMVDSFRKQGISNIAIDIPFDAGYEHTVSATISRECGIPCFQIEMNSRLLRQEYPEYNFNGVLNALLDIIDTMMNGEGKS